MNVKPLRAPSSAIVQWLVVTTGFAFLDAAAWLWIMQVGMAAIGLSLLLVAYLIALSEKA
ncbi:MAG TPA: hypothetical protein VLT90_13145 [Terriglobales bacterium]|nr:hypothetical protein [Terriglobales bacterium]